MFDLNRRERADSIYYQESIVTGSVYCIPDCAYVARYTSRSLIVHYQHRRIRILPIIRPEMCFYLFRRQLLSPA